MASLHLVLLVAAFICFVLAALGVPSRVGLGWAGLACWVSTLIFSLTLVVALSTLAGCASTDQFNRIAADVVGEAITASEQNRCTSHAPPCLSDDQFRAVNLELNKVSVAGREFTKLRIAGTASTKDVATFLGVVAEESAILSRTFPDGAIGDVLTKLIELQAKAVKLLGGN